MDGFEPPTRWLQISRSGQLSYIGLSPCLSSINKELPQKRTANLGIFYRKKPFLYKKFYLLCSPSAILLIFYPYFKLELFQFYQILKFKTLAFMCLCIPLLSTTLICRTAFPKIKLSKLFIQKLIWLFFWKLLIKMTSKLCLSHLKDAKISTLIFF